MAEDRIETVVVIGGGQAAGWVARTLRAEGYTGRLVMIADETHPPYERPPLSKAVLAGEADAASTHLLKPDELAGLAIERWQPERATAIDRERRIVRTESGRELRYDRLVIATGGTARRLPESIVRTPKLHYLRTLDEAAKLGRTLRASRRVLVIGGGWIGLEVAATARKLGIEAVLVEGAPRLCARSLPLAVSDFLLDLHRAQGVELRLGAQLAALDPHPEDASRVRATLADGSVIDADCAVAGIGLVPNLALAREAGLAVEDGIVVDEYGATSDPANFACGDVASHPNAWLKRRTRLESWANAQNQAITAARALLGTRVPYAEIPWFWSDQYDVNLQILGDPGDATTMLVRGDLAARRATLFFVDGVTLRGVIAINTARELKLARKWMNQGRAVDGAALTDTSRALA
ncbi:NAD(P)/FAD-dependent oxidoreductase [Burkholderia gladioli]|uniref:NAD(P)/FAD-dependent oxidoreductase n=1 Tax=Burkholderia gladioli TaxID=28095 RepID=UPI00163F1473|nr:FAD-dependent oxidoreductase [Burkholderia gladioli]